MDSSAGDEYTHKRQWIHRAFRRQKVSLATCAEIHKLRAVSATMARIDHGRLTKAIRVSHSLAADCQRCETCFAGKDGVEFTVAVHAHPQPANTRVTLVGENTCRWLNQMGGTLAWKYFDQGDPRLQGFSKGDQQAVGGVIGPCCRWQRHGCVQRGNTNFFIGLRYRKQSGHAVASAYGKIRPVLQAVDGDDYMARLRKVRPGLILMEKMMRLLEP